jgi:hypothetical protein
MSAHTPTPWILGQDSTVFSENFLCLAIGSPDSDTPIAVFQQANPNASADADFVKRACNSHYALLAACKAAARDTELPGSSEGHALSAGTLEQLKAAIAMAEEA